MSAESPSNDAGTVLVPFKFQAFPTGSISASGWLYDQLKLSADGLGGHLFDFYRYVARSTWLGGEYEYSELHEAAPYWFNFIVPLAWTLDDQRLKDQARRFLDYVLDHQAADGWLGPETTRQTRGLWARSLLCFGLTQYAEADASQTERIVNSMHRFVLLAHDMLKDNFTGLIEDNAEEDNFDPYGFGLARTHELPISLMWLYENYPRNNSAIIMETIELMFAGGRKAGKDWTTFFVDGIFPTVGTPDITTSSFTHGVNLAQGLRYPTVLYRFTGNQSLVEQTANAVNMTAEYQTSLSGSIIADEHLGGLSPERGSETCMAVESMFSYEYLYRFYGINDYADRAERAAFNALPAALTPDWWAHQYVAQTNEPWSRNLTADPFFNVVSYGNTYGLEPNFPCCTVNHPQGLPKFTSSSFVKSGTKDIAHVLLSPVSLDSTINGRRVQVSCETNYPFSHVLKYTIISETEFNFGVRIPAWTSGATVQTGAGKSIPVSPDSSSLQWTTIKAGRTSLTVNLPMEVNVVTRDSSVGIYYGPLLYAADIAYTDTTHQPLNWTDRMPLAASEVGQSRDHVLTPTTPWNYAIDPASITVVKGNEESTLPNPIFARDAPPTSIWVDGYLFDWPENLGTAAVPPINPEVSASNKTKIKLIPFGAAKLHIAQFPVANVVS